MTAEERAPWRVAAAAIATGLALAASAWGPAGCGVYGKPVRSVPEPAQKTRPASAPAADGGAETSATEADEAAGVEAEDVEENGATKR
jgi:hypothetical protein